MDILSNLAMGLGVAVSLENLVYCLIGVILGMIVGVIPGIGTLTAISLLFPLTFYLNPTTALIMLAGIWYGTGYGGRTAAILLNLPGSVPSAVTCLDGYPMARQGRAGVALFMTTVASFVGGTIGILLLTFFAPVIASYALRFGSAEYFALMLLGLVAASAIAEGTVIKGLAMVVLGIMLGCVGADVYTVTPRYTFGVLELTEGLSLIALAMGIFGVSEVISSIGTVKDGELAATKVTMRSMMPTRDDVRRSWKPILRGSGIGSFFGTLPGTGPSTAAFISYAIEKKISREPQRFGKGAIEGVTSPEASDNSAEMTSFIPTLSLGIPGSATMALMLGVLMIHGVTPGPALMTDHPGLFWGLIMSFWIGNVMLVILNVPLIGMWVKLLSVPYHLLYPTILAFVCIGTYTINYSILDVWLVVAFGAFGYLMRLLEWPAPPVLLGFVLGPLLEEHFRRTMLISKGNWEVFLTRPISATVLLLTGLILAWTILSGARSWWLHRRPKEALGSAN